MITFYGELLKLLADPDIDEDAKQAIVQTELMQVHLLRYLIYLSFQDDKPKLRDWALDSMQKLADLYKIQLERHGV